MTVSWLILLVAVSSIQADIYEVEPEKSKQFWEKLSMDDVHHSFHKKPNNNHAKNAILFIGDGMGIPTVTSSRILKGQLEGNSGEETTLAMDRLPFSGMSKTYGVDSQTVDSAASATAYICGAKTNYGYLGLAASAVKANCEHTLNEQNRVYSWLLEAKKTGKSIGVVTTTRITHATPASTYAHITDRDSEDDSKLPEGHYENGCKDIAYQLWEQRNEFTVVMGGGRRHFLPKTTTDVTGRNGRRTDGRDLIQEWKDDMEGKKGGKYVWNKDGFDNIDINSTEYLFGLFGYSHMSYEVDRKPEEEPSLAEMTDMAIQMLSKNENGYALLVEGGRIDHAHHDVNAHRALHDTVAFDKAIHHAMKHTDEKDTLIVVSADHSHTMSMGGYSTRGHSILGLADKQNSSDGKPYTILSYANGNIGYDHVREDPLVRETLTEEEVREKDYHQEFSIAVPWSETHGGEDVFIMARGPKSHLVTGVHQQTFIAYFIRYALCVGKYEGEHCHVHAHDNSKTIASNDINRNNAGDDNRKISDNNDISIMGIHLTASNASHLLTALVAFSVASLITLLCLTVTIMRKSTATSNITHKQGELIKSAKEAFA